MQGQLSSITAAAADNRGVSDDRLWGRRDAQHLACLVRFYEDKPVGPTFN